MPHGDIEKGRRRAACWRQRPLADPDNVLGPAPLVKGLRKRLERARIATDLEQLIFNLEVPHALDVGCDGRSMCTDAEITGEPQIETALSTNGTLACALDR